MADAYDRQIGSQHMAAEEEIRIATARLRAMVGGGPFSAPDGEDIRRAVQFLQGHLRP